MDTETLRRAINLASEIKSVDAELATAMNIKSTLEQSMDEAKKDEDVIVARNKYAVTISVSYLNTQWKGIKVHGLKETLDIVSDAEKMLSDILEELTKKFKAL